MTATEKFEALMTVVRAYLDRGAFVQYDQRAMDRRIQLTQRRAKSLPPEAATEQYTLFLDCSSYMFTLYREAFGIEFPADLTWHMIDYLEPRVYFYKRTGEESEEEIARVSAEIRSTLKPGDVITYDRHSGSGHTMLYIGDGKYTHCTTNFGRPNSYDYEGKKSREYETGLWIDDVDKMIDERIFNEKNNVRRLAISRPLERELTPTKNTLARMGDARGLHIALTASHTLANTATVGDEVKYTLKISAKEAQELKISFTAPDGAILLTDGELCDKIEKDGKISFDFTVKITEKAENKITLDGPRVTVNGLEVFTHQIPLGKSLCESEARIISLEVEKKDAPTALMLAASAYEGLGLKILSKEVDFIRSYFFMYDSTSGDVLYRKPQCPTSDGGLYSLFGGTGVTTPENSANPFIRTTKPMRANLASGDIIIISNDPYGVDSYSLFYTGEALIGKFEGNDEKISSRTGEDIDAFVDSLLGRFAFIVIRPALTK